MFNELIGLFTGNTTPEDLKWVLIQLALTLPIVFFSLSVHETSHGFIANKLGDHTARNLGRLTLNPIKHLDPIGFLCMVLFGFGWAKPVPINTRYFKKPRRDMALTAAAGPISNIALAFIFVILDVTTVTLFPLLPKNEALLNFVYILSVFFSLGASMNVYLAVFNLIPVPPFDGSRIFFVFLPTKLYFGIMKYERIIMIAVLVLFYLGILSVPISFIANLILDGMYGLLGLLPFVG